MAIYQSASILPAKFATPREDFLGTIFPGKTSPGELAVTYVCHSTTKEFRRILQEEAEAAVRIPGILILANLH
jgi:hypothetical protein